MARLHEAGPVESSWKFLWTAPQHFQWLKADAPEIARLQDGASIQILGEIGGQWLHVRFPGGDGPLAGFVPAELVIQRAPNQLEYAVSTVVINRAAKDRAGLRAAPRNDARLLGEYDSGTQILILGHAGKWAQVALEGGADDRATARGYMRLDALDDGSGLLPMSLVTDHYAQADPPEGSGFVTVRAQPDESGAALGKLPRGALFSVLGEAGAWLRIRLDATQGYLPADQVRMLARQNSLGDGPYPWVRQAEGYAVISAPQGAPGVWTYPFCDERAPEGMIGRRVHDTVLLIRDLGDWSQIQDGYTPACFIRSDRLRVLPIPALAAGKTDAGARFALRAGEYTVGRDLPADLYCFRAPQGKAGRIEILGQGGAFIRRYAAENGDFYNLYLPEGARLTLLGDGLLTGLDKTFLWMLGDQSTSYTGSGRFLMRVNVDGTLRVEPASADADAYYIVSAFSQEEGPAPVPVRIHPGQEASIELDDGGFIEIHNCRISTNG
jgi:hypothetical protein